MADAGLIGAAGNQFIVDYLDGHGVGDVPGDVLEIGVFTGGTTHYLAQWAQKHGKRVLAVDPFDITIDESRAALYAEWLDGKNQFELFRENVKDLPVDVCPMESAQFFMRHELVREKFCAAFVDGHHDYRKARIDLHECWRYLSLGGVLLVHDYGHDIPEVTQAIQDFSEAEGAPLAHLPQFVMAAFTKAVSRKVSISDLV